jgi:hypothetical protein
MFLKKFKHHWVGVAAINGLRFFYPFIKFLMPGKTKEDEININ